MNQTCHDVNSDFCHTVVDQRFSNWAPGGHEGVLGGIDN